MLPQDAGMTVAEVTGEHPMLVHALTSNISQLSEVTLFDWPCTLHREFCAHMVCSSIGR